MDLEIVDIVEGKKNEKLFKIRSGGEEAKGSGETKIGRSIVNLTAQ